MANYYNNNTNNGIGFFGLLTLLFIGLKLTNFIDWPWIWVLAPFWLPLTMLILFIFISLFLTAIMFK